MKPRTIDTDATRAPPNATPLAALLLLPGMDGTSSLRSDFISALAATVETTVMSYPTDRPLGYGALESLAREQIPPRPFVLVGESFSGPVAIALAASHPPGLRGLVLVGSFAQCPLRMPRFLRYCASLFPIGLLPARVICTRLLGRNASAMLRARIISAVSSVSARVWRGRLRSVLFSDVVVHLAKIAVPVLYLRAANDAIVPREACELLSRVIPGMQIVELQAPHFMLLANPVESATQVQKFMREVGLAI